MAHSSHLLIHLTVVGVVSLATVQEGGEPESPDLKVQTQSQGERL